MAPFWAGARGRGNGSRTTQLWVQSSRGACEGQGTGRNSQHRGIGLALESVAFCSAPRQIDSASSVPDRSAASPDLPEKVPCEWQRPGVAFICLCGPYARGAAARWQRKRPGTYRCPTAYAWSVPGASSRPGIAMRWFLAIGPSCSRRSKALSTRFAASASSWIGAGASGVVGALGFVTIDAPSEGIGASRLARSSAPCLLLGDCGSQPAGPVCRNTLTIRRGRMSLPTLEDRSRVRRIFRKDPEPSPPPPVVYGGFPVPEEHLERMRRDFGSG